MNIKDRDNQTVSPKSNQALRANSKFVGDFLRTEKHVQYTEGVRSATSRLWKSLQNKQSLFTNKLQGEKRERRTCR